ncbi:MAG: HEAT repeat domain-containing protein, partial [Thermoleophilaceae bacterium]
ATAWIVGELDDLSDPVTRAAVVRYVGRTDPADWFSPQSGMEGLVGALRLLAAEGAPLPDPIDNGSTDPAWRACMTVILGALADAGGSPVHRQSVDAAWTALTGSHRDVLASLLVNVRHADSRPSRQERVNVHELLVAALPPSAIDALVWSVEHPDDIRSLPRYDHGVRAHVIGLLGRIGERRASDALRRLADDPDVGEVAAAAVRAIENRALA